MSAIEKCRSRQSGRRLLGLFITDVVNGGILISLIVVVDNAAFGLVQMSSFTTPVIKLIQMPSFRTAAIDWP